MDDEAASAERRRVGSAYAGYAASAGKRRSWSAENPGNVAIRAELAEAAWELAGSALERAGTILDVGCGSGWWLAQLAADARVAAALHGLELLPERQAAARERVPAAAIETGDARALPYADASFDVVSMLTTLSSLASAADVDRALREAWRVLKPNGVLLIWEPRVPNPFNPGTLFIGSAMLRRALFGARFVVRTTTVLPALSRRLGAATPRLYPRLARVSALRTHRLAVARREREPGALIFVRNTVSHDARVLREADTLSGLGYGVLIAGVVSTSERDTRASVAGHTVIRLDPSGGLRRLRRSRGAASAPATAATAPSAAPPQAGSPPQADSPQAGSSPGRASRLKRVAVTAAYYFQGTLLAWRTRPALVHCNDYNTMWIGIAAKLLRRSRLIYDCHELWPDRNGRPEWRPWLLACEALFVRAADAVITSSPGYAEAMSARYRVPAPVVIRNIPALPAAPPDPPVRSADGSVAVYVGGLMPGRGLEPAIRALVQAPELRLRLIGPGSEAYRERLRALARELGVEERVEFEAAVAPEAVVDAVAEATLGLMLIEPICRSYELTVPNKLFEYAAAGLPILSSDLPVIGPIVEHEQLGSAVPVDNVERVAGAMRSLAEPERNARVRERVREFAGRVTWVQERKVLERVYEGYS